MKVDIGDRVKKGRMITVGSWYGAGSIGYLFDLFGKNNAAVFKDYRVLHQDYTCGSGDDKFKWNVTLHWPILGLIIGF